MGYAVAIGLPQAPFLPTQIANLDLWLRADLGFTPSSWADQSGLGNTFTQSTGVNQPAFSATGGPNSLADVTLSGSQWMSVAATIGPQRSWTAFSVQNVTATGAFQRIFNIRQAWGAEITSTNLRAVLIDALADESADGVSAGYEAWTIQDTGTIQTLRVNGVAKTLSVNNSVPNAGAANSAIGATNIAGAFPMTGRIRELIVYGTVLTAGQISLVEGYIQSATKIW